MSEPTPMADVGSLTFEAALAELEKIVSRLESPAGVGLDESIALYARGEALKKRCETLLAAAEQKIEQVTRGSDGKASGSTPFSEG